MTTNSETIDTVPEQYDKVKKVFRKLDTLESLAVINAYTNFHFNGIAIPNGIEYWIIEHYTWKAIWYMLLNITKEILQHSWKYPINKMSLTKKFLWQIQVKIAKII